VKRSNRLVILVGVLLAVLAFVGIVILLNRPGPGPGGQPVSTVQVMVAREAIEIGDPVTPDSVEPRQVNADAVVNTRIPDASQLTGRPALVPIAAGQQVTQEAVGLVGRGVNEIESSLLAGEKAVAFQVDRVTGLDFLIQAGDRIDIVIAQEVTPIQQTADSVAEQDTNPDAPPRYEAVTGLTNVRTVKTIITDRRVLYVSATRVRQLATGTASASPAQGGQQAAAAQIENVIIVFAGNDQDAELIKFAQRDLGELGALTAVLRRTEDTDEEVEDPDTLGMTLDILVDEFGVPVPDIIVLATQSPNPRNR
jgi:Flp pilus assembly protein CpaB